MLKFRRFFEEEKLMKGVPLPFQKGVRFKGLKTEKNVGGGGVSKKKESFVLKNDGKEGREFPWKTPGPTGGGGTQKGPSLPLRKKKGLQGVPPCNKKENAKLRKEGEKICEGCYQINTKKGGPR